MTSNEKVSCSYLHCIEHFLQRIRTLPLMGAVHEVVQLRHKAVGNESRKTRFSASSVRALMRKLSQIVQDINERANVLGILQRHLLFLN